jgi:hypothetical protein
MAQVFISHSSNDRKFAARLKESLMAARVDVWLDEIQLRVGDSIVEKVSKGIDSSDYFIAILSKSSVKSNWVQKELSLAVTKENKLGAVSVLPVVIDECEIPSIIKDKYFISFASPNKYELEIKKLLDRLNAAKSPELCEYCKNYLPLYLDRCPHCARSSPPPNVRVANAPDEQRALAARYRASCRAALVRGCEEIVSQFTSAMTTSRVILSVTGAELIRLANSENQIFPNYNRLANSSFSGYEGSTFDRRSREVDALLFHGHSNDFRRGVLSLGAVGPINYGTCSLTLRNELIAHRTSFLEEESIRFVERRTRARAMRKIPAGYRAVWDDRGRLAVAKLAKLINSQTRADMFQSLLLRNGKTAFEDDFIEAHVWGPITIRAVESVTIVGKRSRAEGIVVNELRKRLRQQDISVAIL